MSISVFEFGALQSHWMLARWDASLESLKVLNYVTIALDFKQCCAAIFIDLAKAFDTVDHSILVSWVRSIGVSEGSLA